MCMIGKLPLGGRPYDSSSREHRAPFGLLDRSPGLVSIRCTMATLLTSDEVASAVSSLMQQLGRPMLNRVGRHRQTKPT